jgi:hypothetical protein
VAHRSVSDGRGISRDLNTAEAAASVACFLMRNKVAVAAFALLAAGLAAAAPAGNGPRVLVIGVDGLKPDCIPPAKTPALDRLIAEGSYNDDAQAEDLTFSGPNWSSILHGVHRDKHRVYNNEYRPSNLRAWPDFLTLIERHDSDLVTAKVIAWDPIAKNQPSEADVVEIPENNDEGVTEITVKMLSGEWPGMPNGPDVIFIHLDEVDGAGHTYGFDTSQPDYLKGIERADGQIGRIANAMRARPGYADEDWLVVLMSDHGGSIDKGHSGNTPEKRTMPFLVSGRSAVKGSHFPQPRTCDVPATVLAHMGVPVPEGLDWDSRVIGLTETARPTARAGVNLLYNGDAEAQRGFGDRAMDAYALGWNDPGPAQWTVVAASAVDSLTGAGGANVFSGSTSPEAAMSQSIDLAPLRGTNARGAEFELSGRVGVARDSADLPTLSVVFFDSSGAELGRWVAQGPGPDDLSGAAGLWPASVVGSHARRGSAGGGPSVRDADERRIARSACR